YYDPLVADRGTLRRTLERSLTASAVIEIDVTAPLEIPVTYGGDAGPDLPSVAAFARCSEADVVAIHTSVIYRVYMLGFLPGFPYMAAVDSRIAMPRLESPRLNVRAGSVGIAGNQTGIYPFESPGGWRIIGRTRLEVCDLSRDPTFLF